MSVNQPLEFVKRQECTNDAFLGGKLSISQPRAGFRAGLDSVLLGASVSAGPGALLDLGAGAGVAGLCALAHNRQLNATLVERSPQMATFARKNIASNGLEGRCGVLELDITSPGQARTRAGLKPDHFDIVISNPPFFHDGTRAPDAERADARHMDLSAIETWVKAAVSSAHATGEIVFIHLAAALPALLAAFGTRMGRICVLPIAPRPGAPASRVLVRGQKGSRAPMTLLSPLVLHAESGNGFSPRADAIFRGEALVDWR